MGLETMNYVSDFVITNPPNTDSVSQGDDHIRGMKTAIKASFPKDLREVSNPLLGQQLRFGTTGFKNSLTPWGLVLSAGGGLSVAFDNAFHTVTWASAPLDTQTMWSGASPTLITVPASMRYFAAFISIGCYSNTNGSVEFYLVNNTSGSRTPFRVREIQLPYSYHSAGYQLYGVFPLGVYPHTEDGAVPNALDTLSLQLRYSHGLALNTNPLTVSRLQLTLIPLT